MNNWSREQFELKEEHIKLLNGAYVSWDDCEIGAPCIDSKRPYGNSSFFQDMIEILGGEEVSDSVYKIKLYDKIHIIDFENDDIYEDRGEELRNILEKLHRELEIALQIILVTKSFKPGLYECDKYDINWELVE